MTERQYKKFAQDEILKATGFSFDDNAIYLRSNGTQVAEVLFNI